MDLVLPRPHSTSSDQPEAMHLDMPAEVRNPPKSFTYPSSRSSPLARNSSRPDRAFLRSPTTEKGKGKDLSHLNLSELRDCLSRTMVLLDQPDLASKVPGGIAALEDRKSHLEARIQELQEAHDVDTIRQDLDSAKLNDREPLSPGERRLRHNIRENAARKVGAHHISLSESVRLQEADIARMQHEAQISAAKYGKPLTGSGVLKDSLENARLNAIQAFMARQDSDDEEDGEGEDPREEDEYAPEPDKIYEGSFERGYDAAVHNRRLGTEDTPDGGMEGIP